MRAGSRRDRRGRRARPAARSTISPPAPISSANCLEQGHEHQAAGGADRVRASCAEDRSQDGRRGGRTAGSRQLHVRGEVPQSVGPPGRIPQSAADQHHRGHAVHHRHANRRRSIGGAQRSAGIDRQVRPGRPRARILRRQSVPGLLGRRHAYRRTLAGDRRESDGRGARRTGHRSKTTTPGRSRLPANGRSKPASTTRASRFGFAAPASPAATRKSNARW